MFFDRASHSRLQTFIQCQYKYKLQYHDKIPPPVKKEYFEFGHFIHKTFELVVKDKYNLEKAAEIALKEFHNFSDSYMQRAANMFLNFAFLQNMLRSSNPIKDTTEEEFMLPMDENNEFYMKGVIDRKLYYPNGCFIIDYKTTKKTGETDRQKIQSDPQLMTYVWAVSKTDGIPYENIKAALFYAESGNKPTLIPFREKVEYHINSCVQVCKNIKNTPPENARANTSNCRNCEYVGICPHGRK